MTSKLEAAILAERERATSCPEETTKIQTSSQEWIKDAKDVFNKCVPEEYREARLSDFEEGIIVDWSKYGFCLRGKTGIGKTHMATALAREYFRPTNPKTILHETGVYLKDVALKWVSAPSLLSRIRSTFNRKTGETEYDILKEMIRYQLLVLDDLGAEKLSDYSSSTLYALISERRNKRNITIVTTNETLEEINKWEPRIASRLGEMATIKLQDKDRRIEKVSQPRRCV